MVKHQDIVKGSLAAVLAILLAILTGGVSVSASSLTENGIDPAQKGSITIDVNQDEWYVEGTIFRLYKVADLGENFHFSFTDKFKNCGVEEGQIQPVSPTGQPEATADQWMNLSSRFINAVRQQGIPEDNAKSISNREVTFRELSLGLYLIQGDNASADGRSVSYQPVVICIPQRNNPYENWKYSIQSQVKSAYPEYETPTPTVTPTPTATPKVTATPTTTEKIIRRVTPTPKTTKTTGPRRILNVKTGDTVRGIIYVVIMLAAVGVLIGALVARKRHSK